MNSVNEGLCISLGLTFDKEELMCEHCCDDLNMTKPYKTFRKVEVTRATFYCIAPGLNKTGNTLRYSLISSNLLFIDLNLLYIVLF